MFQTLWEDFLKLSTKCPPPPPPPPPHVIIHTFKELIREQFPVLRLPLLKEELILSCWDLELTDEDGVADESQDWLQEIDRGGLKHVNSIMYLLMAAMELELQVLCQAGTQQIKLKEKAIASIRGQQGCAVALEHFVCWLGGRGGTGSVPMILWITMHRFPFASAWAEKHRNASLENFTKVKKKFVKLNVDIVHCTCQSM